MPFRQIPRFLGIGLAAERTIVHVRKDEWASRTLAAPQETAHLGFDVLDNGEKGSWRPITRKAIETTGQLNIGGVPYEDVPVIVVEEISSTGVLGLDFLRGFERTTIDFSKQFLKLEGEFQVPTK